MQSEQVLSQRIYSSFKIEFALVFDHIVGIFFYFLSWCYMLKFMETMIVNAVRKATISTPFVICKAKFIWLISNVYMILAIYICSMHWIDFNITNFINPKSQGVIIVAKTADSMPLFGNNYNIISLNKCLCLKIKGSTLLYIKYSRGAIYLIFFFLITVLIFRPL